MRYDVIQRDGKQTIVHENVTGKQLKEIASEIIKQCGNNAWWDKYMIQYREDFNR